VNQAKPVLARFSLRDCLNRDWHNELVTFGLDPSLVGRSDMALLDAAQRPVPFQWATGSTAGIVFLASVPKFGQVQYSLVERGGQGTEDSERKTEVRGQTSGGIAVGDLTVKDQPESVELGNDKIGIRLNKGAKALTQGPIGGIRLASGKWVGAGELRWPADTNQRTGILALRGDAGGSGVPGCRVRVAAAGPVFAEVESEYTFPNKGYWRLRFRVIAGEPVVLVDEQFQGAPEASYRFKLGEGFEPDHLFWRTKSTGATSRLQDLAGSSAFVLEPWVEWWQTMHGNWLGLYRADSPDLLALGVREAACWVEPGKTTWSTAVNVAKAGLTLEFQLRGLERKWMLIALPKDDALKLSKDSAPLPQQYLVKHGDLPLNQVKDYVLAWPDAGLEHPRLFTTPGELQAFRAGFKADKSQLARLRRVAATANALDDYVSYSLATGDPEVRARLADFAIGQLQIAVDFYVRQVGLPTQGAYPHEYYNEVTPALNALDAVMQPGVLSSGQRERVRAQLAFLGYTLASPSVHSPERGFKATANMTTMIRCELGVLACLIPDHPHAREWATIGIREMANELKTWAGPNGGWLEAPHYATVSLDSIMPLALAARSTRFSETDWTLHPGLKSAARWLAGISSPRDSRLGGQRHLPEIGNTYTGERTCLPGWLARIWKEKDPAFAGQMQWMWQEQGSFTRPGIGGLYPGVMGYSALMFDRSLPAQAPAWGSEWFVGAGAVFRAHFPSDCETYLHYIQGRLHQHYDYDEGSFILWGKGQPLCEDFGYYGRAPAADHNRVDDSFSEDLGSEGKINEFVAGDRMDYLHGERAGWHRQILFVKDQDCLGPNYFIIRDTLTNGRPADWRIWLATDTAPGSAAASSRTPPAPLDPTAPLRIQGRFGVDLVVYLAETSSGTLTTEVLSRTSGASGFKTPTTTQHSLHLRLPPNATVTAVIYPVTHTQSTPTFTRLDHDRALKIDSSFGTDYVFLGFTPFDFSQGNIVFRGQAGAVQLRAGEAQLSLSGKGRLRYKEQVRSAD
jgi:hypothetical protein